MHCNPKAGPVKRDVLIFFGSRVHASSAKFPSCPSAEEQRELYPNCSVKEHECMMANW